jgi:uncharacterized membrane protein YkvA (DUF1232 family)
MDVSKLITILQESKLSPEELGSLIGISGMTVRRWIEEKKTDPLPAIYEKAIRDAVFKLVIDGRLGSDSKLVQKFFSTTECLPQQAALKALGFPEHLDGNLEDHQDQIMVGLAHIGSLESRRQRVEEDRKKLPAYKKMGQEWSRRISLLVDVIGSKNLTAFEKFPAYGALFYLFMTFDLIPDTIPVFGLMDDFAILGIAAAYYLRRLAKAGKTS